MLVLLLSFASLGILLDASVFLGDCFQELQFMGCRLSMMDAASKQPLREVSSQVWQPPCLS